ncbi:MAG: tetratricopeptide repeat protein [Deltaproteobacteria bacterium]|nr:tetratricopeptide repeat protein [Deltaproteobacteria bacterium]
MAHKSPFDRQSIENKAAHEEGLLDQFHLPAAFVAFLRKYQRRLWIITGCIAAIVIIAVMFESFRTYQHNKAVTALTTALQAKGAKKQELLAKVAKQYGSTPAALWSRVELAHIAARNGHIDKALQGLAAVNREVSAENPIKPLLLANLGALYMKNNNLDSALASYLELSSFKGFDADAYRAMGRIYELRKENAKAVAMYKKYLSLSAANGGLAADPDLTIVRAKIKRLQNE